MKIVITKENELVIDTGNNGDVYEFGIFVESFLKSLLPFEEVFQMYNLIHDSERTAHDNASMIMNRIALLEYVDFLEVSYTQNIDSSLSGYTITISSDNDKFIQYLFDLQMGGKYK